MKQLGLSLGGAIRNFERARYTRRQQRAMQLELDLKEIMDPRDAARLAAAADMDGAGDPIAAALEFASEIAQRPGFETLARAHGNTGRAGRRASSRWLSSSWLSRSRCCCSRRS